MYILQLSKHAFLLLSVLSILSPTFGKDSIADPKSTNTSYLKSATDFDELRRQIASHWNIPADTKEPKNAYVDIQVEMNPDATVRSATVISTSKPINDPVMKAFADSAIQAIKNASPLKLPLDRYEHWKTITIHFDPGMIL